MKVVYILNIFPKITETFILNEMLAMQRKGINVEVYAYHDAKEDRVHPRAREIPVRYFAKYGFFKNLGAHFYLLFHFPKDYFKTLWLALTDGDGIRMSFLCSPTDVLAVLQRKPDHLHAHFGDESSNTAFLIHSLSSIPFSFTTHSYDIEEGKYDNWKVKSKRARMHVTISEDNRERIIDNYDVRKEDITVIHCGIDFGRILDKPQAREENFIFSVARLHREKGLDMLVRACKKLKEEGVSFRCEIAGDGTERADLERLVSNFGLQDRVKLLGNRTQEEVFECFRQASIFVLPSRFEGIPVSLMEAMAFRVPVISTWVCGIPELIQDGHSGYLVQPDDPDKLADRMKELLGNAALRKTFSDNGYRKVRDEFDLEKETDKLLAIWKRRQKALQ